MNHYGFNMLWMFAKYGNKTAPEKADEKELEFIAKHGFNFIRIPTDYRFWTKDFDYFNPDKKVFEQIDDYIKACLKYGLHVSLNFHRTPGYCINNNHEEKHNLWKDEIAFEAFVFLWETMAKRYRGIPAGKLSFDLLNEPPSIRQYGFNRKIHRKIMLSAIDAIKAVDPERPIVINGINCGHVAMPEMADSSAIHSGRGYTPFLVSHYKANWCGDIKWKKPVYPGVMDDDIYWDRNELLKFYKPWRNVEKKGVKIHIGEFGCYNKTPNDVALRWLSDLMSVYKEFGWGYALWNFTGPFGIVEHGRPKAVYTDMDGLKVDKQLLDIMKENMVK